MRLGNGKNLPTRLIIYLAASYHSYPPGLLSTNQKILCQTRIHSVVEAAAKGRCDIAASNTEGKSDGRSPLEVEIIMCEILYNTYETYDDEKYYAISLCSSKPTNRAHISEVVIKRTLIMVAKLIYNDGELNVFNKSVLLQTLGTHVKHVMTTRIWNTTCECIQIEGVVPM